ncbi:MaoC family dehydratase [Pseudomonas sp. MYb185]|uniref:MaoC family dehydratase n=1 Tax=Pseudomonas sp. MYb185 TaxID=1848729 RepID=UPI000CFDD9F8|nr:MaoC family dehydratase [Pseudomonas sp. MYb185]PRB83973.1 dehydratase [Pseudomonas sp. MYb185]
MTTTFNNAAALEQAVGQSLGVTEWITIDQQRVDTFADATGDHQWIHVDPEKAKAGPFGGTIAHGYLTLSLVNYFLPQLMQVENLQMGVNYGCDRVRFPAPVRVGARIRGNGEITQVETLANGAVQVVVRVSVEVEGSDRPGCVVDTISRYTFNQTV